jgi:hypothetical protein
VDPSINPYAPPTSTVNPGAAAPDYGTGRSVAGRDYWREGKEIVIRRGAELPPRCVRTNEPTDFRLHRKLRWHPQWIFIFIVLGGLIGIVLYLVVSAIFRKTAELDIPLSPAGQQRRKTGIICIVAGIVGGVLLSVVGGALELAALILVGVIGGLIAAIVGAVIAPPLRVKKIDDHFIRVFAGDPFLESIPPYQG